MQLRGLVAFVLTVGAAACSDTAVDEIDNACQDYCALAMRNCQGTVAQYSDLASCEATCATMPLGTPGGNNGNNIACRTFWAAISEGEPSECVKAGPGGAGMCGSNCESFCAATMSICADEPNLPYDSAAECMGACAGFSATEVYDASDIAGNTLACRIYHMTAASTDPGTHCQHTSVASAVCF